MSSITLITIIIVLLAALVCYAFVVQSVRQENQQKERLVAGLKVRARNFHHMLDGFPSGFLPRDLTLLVQRSLQHVYDQLARLEPKNREHNENMRIVAAKMATTQKQSDAPAAQVSVENIQQISDIKSYLEELFKYIVQLEMKKQLTQQQGDGYRTIIKQLLIQLSIDAYILHGRTAQEKDKPRLACHYYDLAQKLMHREGRNGQFDAKMVRIRAIKQELEKLIIERGESYDPGIEIDASVVNPEWEAFDKLEQSWKKKQLYD